LLLVDQERAKDILERVGCPEGQREQRARDLVGDYLKNVWEAVELPHAEEPRLRLPAQDRNDQISWSSQASSLRRSDSCAGRRIHGCRCCSSGSHAQIEDIEWISPMQEGALHPLRAGHLKLDKLWVVDSFGRPLKLAAAELPRDLHSLPPRLSQSARLQLTWLPHDERSPGAALLPDRERAQAIIDYINDELLS
jgi:hypothetical protein